MSTIQSFAPIEPTQAKVLVLGSMPGKASLRAQQYYAHPRNAFWPIWARLLGFDAAASYAQKVAHIAASGVGVWDVLAACTRTSSLDSDIVESSIVPNDFAGWFERQPQTRAVFCNGAKAFDSYRKYVIPALAPDFAALPLIRLPSTSPAHARLTLDEKFADWSVVKLYLFG
ncbi:DNA-deoxyinosine glycosylase [Saccharospirillum sp. MSK14-1]|uniref:DNA-deoxyinosine glycosylase n=1 Tax=Saccharospirillum sp. MSK14-1 TaxID=1897632 RepID=UPI000D369B58|nr:DNA-deoxyinosine glycosylase [Saccharospirillum sp. MSK14-1]PTY37460.1 DNA-deoxyinosine glycosylase [Saccharospirillum sp. MSK14-1]